MRQRAAYLNLLLLLIPFYGSAQQKTVLLDPRTRQIAGNDLLPDQEPFVIQVPVQKNTAIVRVHLFSGNRTADVVKNVYWIRPVNFSQDLAEILVDENLHGNRRYGFDVRIFTFLGDSERVALRETMHAYILNYLDAAWEAGAEKVGAAKSANKMLGDLNAIVAHSLMYFENIEQRRFDGFSDIVKMKLLEVQKARLSNAVYNLPLHAADSTASPTGLRASYASRLLADLQQSILTEVDNFLRLDFVRLTDAFVIYGKHTERSPAVLPLFVGYGAAYLGGSAGNARYDAKAYAGFSIPFGSGDKNYFSRIAFNMGIFLNNFEDGQGNKFTGPVVDRPVFAGLGCRLFSIIHLNAGVIALSTDKVSLSDVSGADITLKPFIGLSAQFNLWLGLHKRS